MIEVKSLTRDYGRGKGIFDVSFRIEKGEVFGFLGPNGAGKTTTIRHLMGFLKPRSGSCSIDHEDCWAQRHQIQSRVGYIPGEISFFNDMTGVDYLDFLARYQKLPSDTRRNELMELFQFDPKGKIRKMSKGMKQKLALVASMMKDPEILILDEPTSGFDPIMQNRFIDFIQKEKKRGKTILLSSHIFEEVERTCDRVGIIRNGRLVAVDSVEDLRKRHVRTYTVELETEELAGQFARDFGGSCDGRRVTISSIQSLEEIFMHFYGENET